MSSSPYPEDTLYVNNDPRTFPGTASMVAFPLGGIGTGNVSLGARGQLRDWELFNRPGKDNHLPFSFFALRCESEKGDVVSRVLESKRSPPHQNWYGFPSHTTAGLPRFENSEFTGEYPIAEVALHDERVPVNVSLTAYTPFVPLNPEKSGIPVAVLEYDFENPTNEQVELSVVGSLPNPVGFTEMEAAYPRQHRPEPRLGGNRNEFRTSDGLSGLHFTSEKYGSDDRHHGEASLVVLDEEDVTHKTSWIRHDYPWTECQEFWDDFDDDGRLEDNVHENPSPDGRSDVGSVGARLSLDSGERRSVTFLLTWYFPNRPYQWDELNTDHPCRGTGDCCLSDGRSNKLTRNHYATRFDGAWDVAESVASDRDVLERQTYAFHDAFFESTLPGYVLEAVSSNIAVARSTTCMWLADGSFLAYEGCYPNAGCCEGTCTHVWNYAQTLAFLFPSLEREMRRIDFEHSTDPETGKMDFRTQLPFGSDRSRRAVNERPAADGQMGTIMRLYREWKYAGDDAFLERLWPRAKRVIEFAFEEWDPDEDGVMEERQHNTHDIRFYGPNTMVGTWYLGALKAGAEMARTMGDEQAARRYERRFESGREELDRRLWNGQYYTQGIDDVDEHEYQYGIGCLSDQLIGQWFAEVVDLGDLLPPAHVRETLSAIFEHNFRESLSEHANCQRTYALNDEAGLLNCTWPQGGRPDHPFRSDEVWTGVEYQVASHLIYEGMLDEGLSIVRAVRDRHDGVRRNPWNEFECGNHYARAMSSWAVYAALCGIGFEMTDGSGSPSQSMQVRPAIEEEDFSCFWITDGEWGRYERGVDEDGEISERYETLYNARSDT